MALLLLLAVLSTSCGVTNGIQLRDGVRRTLRPSRVDPRAAVGERVGGIWDSYLLLVLPYHFLLTTFMAAYGCMSQLWEGWQSSLGSLAEPGANVKHFLFSCPETRLERELLLFSRTNWHTFREQLFAGPHVSDSNGKPASRIRFVSSTIRELAKELMSGNVR